MRTWVDERGQVRFSASSQDGSGTASSGAQDAGNGDGESSRQQDKTSHPEFNLQQYPDAGEKRRQGKSEELFYSWRNARGRVFNTPYLYEEESMGRVMRESAPKQASEARVTTAASVAAPGFRQDSEAAAVMGLDEEGSNRLDAFSQQCCRDLPRLSYKLLEPERSLAVSLGEEADVHRFATGKSRFVLVRLPREPKQSLLRIRSFIRNGGFLVPNAVFLDDGFQPVRMVTDIVMAHSPETWRRYGHMEARVALRPESDERWLVVFTRSADLESSTEVGVEGQRYRLTHEPSGSLSLHLVD
ncbi:MalM family protein [Halomonadaceae bacterium KBTZ08]